MGKYNSTEQRISITLSEYQILTLDSRVLGRLIREGDVDPELYEYTVQQLEKEDMSDE